MRKLLFILLLCLFTTSGFGQFIQPQQKPMLGLQINWVEPITKDIVAYWSFQEGAGNTVLDLSGNGNTGTIAGGAPWIGGKFGIALDITGASSQNVIFANEANFDFEYNQPFSVSLWFNTDSGSDAQVFSKQMSSPGYTGYALACIETTDQLQFYLQNDNSPSRIARIICTYTNVGVWDHVVCVSDGTGTVAGLHIYLNGVELGVASSTDTLAGNTILNAISFQLCGRNGSSTYSGLLDNVIFFNRALSSSEVERLYREPFCMFQPSWNWILYGGISVPSGDIPIFMYHYMNH